MKFILVLMLLIPNLAEAAIQSIHLDRGRFTQEEWNIRKTCVVRILYRQFTQQFEVIAEESGRTTVDMPEGRPTLAELIPNEQVVINEYNRIIQENQIAQAIAQQEWEIRRLEFLGRFPLSESDITTLNRMLREDPNFIDGGIQ